MGFWSIRGGIIGICNGLSEGVRHLRVEQVPDDFLRGFFVR